MTVERLEGIEPLAETETSAQSTTIEATAVSDADATTQGEHTSSGSPLDGADDVTATVDGSDTDGASAGSEDATPPRAGATDRVEVSAADPSAVDGASAPDTSAEPTTDHSSATAAIENAIAADSADEEAPAQAASAAPAAVAEPTTDDVSDAPSASDDEGEATADETAVAAAQGAEAPAAPAPPPPVIDTRPEPTTMEELLSEQTGEIRSLKHGDVVEGSVVRIDKDEILVDIGAKSEGVVSNRELYGRNAESQPALNIGDVVLVYVLQPESNEGHAVLSLRRAGLERKWRAMQEQLDAGAIIEAPVIDHNKGGLIVDCGIRGFVPISQIVDFPRRPQNEQPRDAAQEIAEKLQPYVGRKLRLKILEVNRKANRLILSEKVALYEERREKRDELFSSLKVGQQVKGSVRSIAPFGVFVDLGGIDGLVHKSELSWNKVNNPESGYRVGEEVEAEVIDINHERGRISLSIRRLQPDPWHSTVADLKVGDIIEGTVTKIVNFGAFVRVREGLEGLIHISELSQQRVAHPGDVVHEGQKLRLKVISLDSERHRLGLSLKQAEEAPARAIGAPAEGTTAPRERRGRPERSYDASQAVQEPEGGIDNTLAAAFAQVRQQIADQDRAATSESEIGDATQTVQATADAEPEAAPEAEAPAEPATGKAEATADAEPEAAPEAEAPTEPATGKAETIADAEPEAAPEPPARATRSRKEPATPAPEDAPASTGRADTSTPDAPNGTDEEPSPTADVSALDINPDSADAIDAEPTAAETTGSDEADTAG